MYKSRNGICLNSDTITKYDIFGKLDKHPHRKTRPRMPRTQNRENVLSMHITKLRKILMMFLE